MAGWVTMSFWLFDGNDIADGDEGNDRIFGQAGDDILSGGVGDDFILGGEGDDTIFGNDGDDELRGGPGYDKLRGNAGSDLLKGDQDFDSLIGGTGEADILDGGSGGDRMLAFENDSTPGRTAQDARINFRDSSSVWTDREMEVIDDGFELLHIRIENTRLLRDSIATDPIVFIKSETIPASSRIASNQLAEIRDGSTVRLERQMTFADWTKRHRSK